MEARHQITPAGPTMFDLCQRPAMATWKKTRARRPLALMSPGCVAASHFRNPQALRGYLELHIEQGPILVSRGLPVGIVTGIRGNRRLPQGDMRIPARLRDHCVTMRYFWFPSW